MTNDKLKNPVLDYYLDTGEACTVTDLMQHSGWSRQRLNNWLNTTSLVNYTHKNIAVDSHNYPGMFSHERRVHAVIPTRESLRALIQELQQEGVQ